MVQKTKEVIDELEGLKTKPILREEIKQILKKHYQLLRQE